jgi:hypothetical protein
VQAKDTPRGPSSWSAQVSVAPIVHSLTGGGGSTRMEAQDFIVDRSLVYEKGVCGIIL